MNIYIKKISYDKLDVGFQAKMNLGTNKEFFVKYQNVEYFEPSEYAINNDDKNLESLHVIRFKNLDSIKFELVEYILKEIIEPLDQSKTTICDALLTIFEYFEQTDKEIIENKLIGDIGEIVAILKFQLMDIDYSKYYQIEDNSLFDFSFPNHYVDVKTTSVLRKTIHISRRQLESDKKINFLVVEINKLQGKNNIINLINLINNKTNFILDKLSYWNKKYYLYKNIIDSWTIDIDSCNCYLVDEETIPKINIPSPGGLIDLHCKISVAQSKKNTIQIIKKWCE